MRILARFLLDPFFIFWLIAAVGLLASRWKKKRWATGIWIGAFVWLFLVSTDPLPDVLIKDMEGRYSSFKSEALADSVKVSHILVLGGGHTFDERLPYINRLSLGALGRLVEGMRIHHLLPNSKLVCSGWSSEGVSSQAEVTRKAAVELGFAPDSLLVLTEPRNTQEEALRFRQRFGRQTKFVLVTDALHMPRAMYLFRGEGLNPIPAPTNHTVKEDKRGLHISLIPDANNISNTGRLFHEYGGILWARLNR